ncbi:hypothetical protein Lal_00018158 [Lupinus albus]|nr:hypothetical protein Lal_00018158 [Lupinus albus]
MQKSPQLVEYAVAFTSGDKYLGAKAAINIWNPKVEQTSELSVSQMWVLAGGNSITSTNDVNSIEIGAQEIS